MAVTAQTDMQGAATLEIAHLRHHMFTTYITLRIGMGVMALALPLILWWGGGLAYQTPLKGSMSAYYESPMRDWFVGFLFAVGAALYLYKGFSNAENIALNLAGLFAIGVALIPTGTSWLHGASALALFACMVFVALVTRKDTLKYILDEKRLAFYTWVYNLLALLMFVLPIAAAVLIVGYQWHTQSETKSFTFAAEFGAIWAFAAFWLVKAREVWRTQQDAVDQPTSTPTPAPAVAARAEGAAVPATSAASPVRSRATPAGAPAKAAPEAKFLA